MKRTRLPILHSFAYALDYLCDLVADATDAQMVAQPPGVVNHPAWVIGHLTHACELLGGVIGLRDWLPAGWARRYGTGSAPAPDIGRYETKAELLATLREAQDRIARAVEALDEVRLDEPFPDPSLRDVFPTVRHALTQVLVGHTAYHVAQVAAWRRVLGLPPIGRSFE